MTSLKAVSITTKYSAGGCDDSSSESEFSDSSDSFPVTDSSEETHAWVDAKMNKNYQTTE